MPSFMAATGERTRDLSPHVHSGVPSGGPQARGPTRSLSADFVPHRLNEVITKHPVGLHSDWVHGRVPNTRDITCYDPEVKYVYKIGHMPDPRLNKALGNIVHYMGHIPKERQQNIHGMSIQKRNEVVQRGSNLNRTTIPKSERMVNPPHVPGYMGFIPGKAAETVHGDRFGWANETAQELREYNPYCTTGSYIHRINRNRTLAHTQMQQNTVRADFMNHMTKEEKMKLEPYMQKIALKQDLLATTRRKPEEGPRYLHKLDPHFGLVKRVASDKAHGQASESRLLEQERWVFHNRDLRESNCSANMRNPF